MAFYDKLVLATGSYPFVPPIAGADGASRLVYRTLDDLDQIRAAADGARRGVVVGGGLLGLEAANALKTLGLETHVVEFAPMLMAVQLDEAGGAALKARIEALGVGVHLSRATQEIMQEGTEARKTMRFADGSELEVDFIVFSTGIRPRDKLATQCGLAVAQRGGIMPSTAIAAAAMRRSTPSANAPAGTTAYTAWWRRATKWRRSPPPTSVTTTARRSPAQI